MAHYLLNLLMGSLGARHCNEGKNKIQVHQDCFVEVLGGKQSPYLYMNMDG